MAMDISRIRDNVRFSMPEPTNSVMDEVHRRLKHGFQVIQQQGFYGSHVQGMMTSYKSVDTNKLMDMIGEVVSNPKTLARLLTDEHTLRLIIDIHERKERKLSEHQYKLENRKTEQEATDQYNEAVDIVDEFEEVGIKNLDEEQKKMYDELIEVIRKYEES